MHTVLLVDDNAKLRRLYRLSLEMAMDLKVVAEASDGLEAIERAREKQPDLILLDLSMPTMDGLEALGHLRETTPRSHVVVLTGFRSDGLGALAIELGASGYIEKGISPTHLAARVREVALTPVPEYHPPAEERRLQLQARMAELV